MSGSPDVGAASAVPEPTAVADSAASAAHTRTVDVPVRRLDAWLVGFARRHGPTSTRLLGAGPDSGADFAVRWEVTGADGHSALVEVPGWLAAAVHAAVPSGLQSGLPGHAVAGPDARPDPTFAVLAVRRAGYAAAVFRGQERLWSKVGTRHIHGRTAAGGWSQQRYARRRANQADEIVAALATSFARGVHPHLAEVAVLVTGGDRALLSQARDELSRTDRRLADLLAGLPEVRLPLGTPRAADLAGMPDRVLTVKIHVNEPPRGGSDD